ASSSEVRAVLGWRGEAATRKVFSKPLFSFMRGKYFVVEPHFHYWAGIRSVPASAYLQGYWQSEKYFADAADTLRADFTFRQPLSQENAAWVEKIGSCT